MINKLNTMKSIAVVFCCTLLSSPALSQETLDKAGIEKIVREYLLTNPEILLEVQNALEAKQQQELAASQKEIITAQKEQIFSAPYHIEIGNPNAEKSNNNIKFVMKEFPVLGEGSIEASRVSMAFSKLMPEKHAEFHTELLGLPGHKDANSAMDIAVKMGANKDAVLAEMENPKIIETIQATYGLANGLGITGTPSYIVGTEVVFGAVGHDQLDAKIKGLSQ